MNLDNDLKQFEDQLIQNWRSSSGLPIAEPMLEAMNAVLGGGRGTAAINLHGLFGSDGRFEDAHYPDAL